MLKIRPEQLQVFKADWARRFEDWMIGHIKEFFPEKFDEMGEEEVRESIHHGLKRARAYRIEQGPDVCLYIDTMLLLGRDFDIEPANQWARDILNDQATAEENSKAQRLYSVAKKRTPHGSAPHA